MSDLPRFNQGSVGSLQWHHLNRVFDAVESGREPVRYKPAAQESSFVYAVLTGQSADLTQAARYSWREVERNPNTGGFATREGGRTSGEDNPFQIPAMGVSGTELFSIGDLVILRLETFSTGQRFAHIVSNKSAGLMFKITGGISISSGRWRYTGVPVAVDNGAWVNLGSEVTLYNGCENATDSGNIIGVGTVKLNNTAAIRQRIRNDVVVNAVYINGGWSFSIPNGYSFSCT